MQDRKMHTTLSLNMWLLRLQGVPRVLGLKVSVLLKEVHCASFVALNVGLRSIDTVRCDVEILSRRVTNLNPQPIFPVLYNPQSRHYIMITTSRSEFFTPIDQEKDQARIPGVRHDGRRCDAHLRSQAPRCSAVEKTM